MVEEPLSVLHVLSITAVITTISLFFCGIPICLQIWRRKSTEDITGFPFIMGFLVGTFWLRYGLLKLDLTMITVNMVGMAFMFLYLMIYVYYTKSKALILFELIVVFGIICTMLVLVKIYGMAIINLLGFACMTFTIINFGAPLAGVAVVFKKKTCENLPLPLCTATLLVSAQWCLYGCLTHDIYITITNSAGVLLALLQISLFLVFPRIPGGRAPFGRCCRCINGLERADKSDIVRLYQPLLRELTKENYGVGISESYDPCFATGIFQERDKIYSIEQQYFNDAYGPEFPSLLSIAKKRYALLRERERILRTSQTFVQQNHPHWWNCNRSVGESTG
ncbi:sugar efflux transporter for intercellular exchange domain-containing protein [Ditylenchus destructor]|uniref:Sugar transporter SWEET1 n=1 Tax=Ditylenchus destructor TaxID=166010 RepID=A0AAD4MJR5_9BILA|nr:sugar efflux transporter for intercellular exchange domain-containing protein [Ditylenchus destructor]